MEISKTMLTFLFVCLVTTYVHANVGEYEDKVGTDDALNGLSLIDRVRNLEERDKVLVGRVKELENRNIMLDNQVAELKTRDELQMELLAKLQSQDQLQRQAIDQMKSEIAIQKEKINILKSRTVDIARLNSQLYQITSNNKKTLLAKQEKYTNETTIYAGGPDTQVDDKKYMGNRIRQAENEVTVAFSAALSNSSLHLGANQNIVFDHVETNIGKGYNAHHGVFIAPVAGTYVFYTSLMSARNARVNCKIVVNGILKASIFANDLINAFDQGSNMIIIRLDQADDVSVQSLGGDAGVFDDYALYSTFSGFLLKQSYDQAGTIVG